MKIIEGRLLYLGWFNRPWTVITSTGEIDLWPIVEEFFVSLGGKRADHKRNLSSYTLAIDEDSDFHFEYARDDYLILTNWSEFGGSNVHAYIDTVLIWLSGRMIKVSIEDGKQISFSADPSEKVHGLRSMNTNSCKIPEGTERSICKIGEPDCCIFICGNGHGFSCEKFNPPIARALLNRLAKKDIRATRIGNCAFHPPELATA